MDSRLEKKFWNDVAFLGAEPGECWVWTGGKTSNGAGGRYGEITLEKRKYAAHRVSYEIANGKRPVGDVLHSCDNPPCCNPEHLRDGTPSDNLWDKLSRHGGRKLTLEQVEEIRRAGTSGVAVARKYGIGYGHLRQILTHKIWNRKEKL